MATPHFIIDRINLLNKYLDNIPRDSKQKFSWEDGERQCMETNYKNIVENKGLKFKSKNDGFIILSP